VGRQAEIRNEVLAMRTGGRFRAIAIGAATMAAAVLPAPHALAGPTETASAPGRLSVKKFANLVYETTTAYDGSQLKLKLDLYVPQGPGMSGPWPALVMLHGGGWGDGTRSDIAGYASDFAKLGFAAYDIDFRESCDPHNPPSGDDPSLCGWEFPTHEQDVQAAVAWVRQNAPLHPEWETMPSKVAVWGTSSGANIAMSVADGYAGDTNPIPPGPGRPDAVVDWSGGTDYVDGRETTDQPSRLPDYVGCHPYQTPTDCPGGADGATHILETISPLWNLSADDPPAFIMQSTDDPLLPADQHAIPYDDALQSLGIAEDLYMVNGSCHGLKCTVLDPSLEQNNANWLHQLLGPKQPTAPILSAPNESTPLGQATFAFSVPANGSVQCSLDGAALAPCTTPKTFTALQPGQHSFETVATDLTGTGDPTIYAWTISPRTVSITDSGFDPTDLSSVTPGSWVQWTNDGTKNHTVTDTSGMKLFDSGPIAPGHLFKQPFIASGVYGYTSSSDPSWSATVKVPVQATPKTVAPGNPYVVTWAAQAPPPGFGFDVQYKSPGASKWSGWQNGVTTMSATVATTSSTTEGGWGYRARAHQQSTGLTSQWSATTTVTVTSQDVTPPVVTITSGPATPTTDTSATFTYSANEPSTFTCSLDGAASVGCPSTGVTYSSLATGSHTFRVIATDTAGNVGSPASASWYVSVLKPTIVNDAGFKKPSLNLAFGTTVEWQNYGALSHTATDSGQAALFDSGPIAPGASFSYFLDGASTYTIASTGDSFPPQTIRIPPVITPTSGGTTTPFTVAWAAIPPPPNLMFDVYVQEPGSTQFVQWQLGAGTTQDVFTPDAGPGTYTFRVRLRNLADQVEAYSPTVSITVS
jgi:acetyl esterase/lipase/plastocyanin